MDYLNLLETAYAEAALVNPQGWERAKSWLQKEQRIVSDLYQANGSSKGPSVAARRLERELLPEHELLSEGCLSPDDL